MDGASQGSRDQALTSSRPEAAHLEDHGQGVAMQIVLEGGPNAQSQEPSYSMFGFGGFLAWYMTKTDIRSSSSTRETQRSWDAQSAGPMLE